MTLNFEPWFWFCRRSILIRSTLRAVMASSPLSMHGTLRTGTKSCPLFGRKVGARHEPLTLCTGRARLKGRAAWPCGPCRVVPGIVELPPLIAHEGTWYLDISCWRTWQKCGRGRADRRHLFVDWRFRFHVISWREGVLISVLTGVNTAGCGSHTMRMRPALIFQSLHTEIFLDKFDQVLSENKWNLIYLLISENMFVFTSFLAKYQDVIIEKCWT